MGALHEPSASLFVGSDMYTCTTEAEILQIEEVRLGIWMAWFSVSKAVFTLASWNHIIYLTET